MGQAWRLEFVLCRFRSAASCDSGAELGSSRWALELSSLTVAAGHSHGPSSQG